MGLGIHRKSQKVPDLSRYDYHYQQKANSGPGNELSAAAAASAGRSKSLINSSSAKPQTRPQGVQGRSYSLRHGGNAGLSRPNYNSSERLGSLTKKRPPVNPSSRSNSMVTVQTTEIKDSMGRTQSITKRTVRRVNGYEYVETRTTTTTGGPQDPEKHFNEFTSDFSQDFENHQEPMDLDVEPVITDSRINSGVSDILREEDEDEDADDANFSDAMDYIPQPKTSSPRNAPATSRLKKSSKPRQVLSEEEQYAKALAAAQKKVYGDRPLDNMGSPTLPRSTRRMSSLRSPPPAAPPISDVNRKNSSRKVFASPKRDQSNSISDVRRPERTPTTHKNQSANLGVSPKARRMSDSEMYAKALEIARRKYNVEAASNDAQQPKQKPDQWSTQQTDFTPAGKPSGSNSKVKNFFNRVAQFSQDNYGYQNKKNWQNGAARESASFDESEKRNREPLDFNDIRQDKGIEDSTSDKRFQAKVNNVVQDKPHAKKDDASAFERNDDAWSDKVGHVHVDPAHVEPAHVALAHVEPVHAEPVHAEPVHAEPIHAEPVHAEPVHVEPVKAKLVKSEVAEVEPALVEPVQVAPVDGKLVVSKPAGVDAVLVRSSKGTANAVRNHNSESAQIPLPDSKSSSKATNGNNAQSPAFSAELQPPAALASSVSSSQANFSRQSVRGSVLGQLEDTLRPSNNNDSIKEVPETSPSEQPLKARKLNFFQKLFKRSRKNAKHH
ncbi:LANO_0E11144g1_1 [Lachancea nothofagi CBS 11611]|uniref:LANO_0E11144g1_1 n=1 Tax=Lachancea nothofagi CBS 11611 TaxID=1266666 RepID=A0A1G4JX68_9SACH|nr:LANO_0E11144g1_1 [Lachancea nothofagi CBS 11611]